MHPKEFAGRSVECEDRAPCTARRVQDAVGHQRRAFVLKLRSRTEIIGFEAPCEFKLVEVRSVDLIESGVVRISEIASVRPPLSSLCACLSEKRRCGNAKQTDYSCTDKPTNTHRSS